MISSARSTAIGDGSITDTENEAFLDSAKSRQSGPPSSADMAKKLFEKADGDGDGKITKEELESALPRHDSSKALDSLFSDADSDEDGAISQGELEAGLEAHFSQRAMTYTADGSQTVSTGSRFSRFA